MSRVLSLDIFVFGYESLDIARYIQYMHGPSLSIVCRFVSYIKAFFSILENFLKYGFGSSSTSSTYTSYHVQEDFLF